MAFMGCKTKYEIEMRSAMDKSSQQKNCTGTDIFIMEA